MEPPSGFEHETPGLGIQHLNHYAIAIRSFYNKIIRSFYNKANALKSKNT